jgi:glycosyltransferase involved in cell wall biosynthesis
MPRFSIVITVFNRPDLVRQAVDSALAQGFADREIVVVDDSSTDNTPEVLKSYGKEIRVVTTVANQGCEMAYRTGVEASTGDYLVFLDSDDLLYPWALAVYDFVINAARQPALLVSRLAFFSTIPQALAAPERGAPFEAVVYRDYLSKDRTISSSLSMVVVRRDVYAESGGFRISTAATYNGSDHDFLLRIGCHGPAVLIQRPQTVAYRVHPGNSTQNLRRVVEGILRLIAAERRGAYPGGRDRRPDRRAMIGNQVYWWSRRSLLGGQPWLAVRLLFSGWDMVVARLRKRLRTSVGGLVPVTVWRDAAAEQSAPSGRQDRR